MERAGVVGEEKVVKLLYLALVSRLLERPVNIAVKGPSSAGKSYLIERVVSYFPPSAYYGLTSMSERALAYSEEPLEHRFLVFYEFAGVQGETRAYFVRSLLSEGRLRYETVEKTAEGLKARTIDRAGPTGLILSTTKVNVDRELETRLISVTVTDSPDQTKRVMLQLAKGHVAPAYLDRWHALQELLDLSLHRVEIPYATALAELIPPDAVRLRRDFGAVLGLIAAHAVLHQGTRASLDGALLATIDDYRVVHELVADLVSEGVEATVAETVRETVAAVARIGTDEKPATLKQLGKELGLDSSSVYRRAAKAIDGGWIVNTADKGKPFKLVKGADLPEDKDILPKPWRLEDAMTPEAEMAAV
jgi:hypothetical protein